MEQVDITFAKDGVARIEDLDGQLAAHLISVNQPIYKSDFKRELAVTRRPVDQKLFLAMRLSK